MVRALNIVRYTAVIAYPPRSQITIRIDPSAGELNSIGSASKYNFVQRTAAIVHSGDQIKFATLQNFGRGYALLSSGDLAEQRANSQYNYHLNLLFYLSLIKLSEWKFDNLS